MCSSAIYNSILSNKDIVTVDFTIFDRDLLDALAEGYFASDISEKEKESSFDTTFCQGWIDFPVDSEDDMSINLDDTKPFECEISAILQEETKSNNSEEEDEEEWKDLTRAIDVERQRVFCL